MSASMKFRQRMAWLFVIFYLGVTFAFFNYLFEINDHYNSFALDHVQKYHTPDVNKKGNTKPYDNTQSVSLFSSVWGHVTDLPLPVWILIFLLPYLQIFLMILACTRAEPRMSMAYLWPGLLYLKYQQVFKKQSNSIAIISSQKQALPTNGTNGFMVIHT